MNYPARFEGFFFLELAKKSKDKPVDKEYVYMTRYSEQGRR